jgi:hypothetical protein
VLYIQFTNIYRRDIGYQPAFLGSTEAVGINPLLINLYRAQEYRYIHKIDQLQIHNIPIIQNDPNSTSIPTQSTEDSTSQSAVNQERQNTQYITSRVNVNINRNVNVHLIDQTDQSKPDPRKNRVLRTVAAAITDAIPRTSGEPIEVQVREVHECNTEDETLNLRENRDLRPQRAGRPKVQTRSIEINGTIVQYTKDDIKWPTTAVSFATDIRRSLREWDDDSRIQLRGHAVPVRLWASLLKGTDSKQWDTLKKQYSELKVRSTEKTCISVNTSRSVFCICSADICR